MVQGENNTVVTTQSAVTNNTTNQAKLFENMAMQNDTGEKKKKVGNYIISKTIGEGSFAKVREGFHLLTQQKVAVKVINKREVLKRNYLRANLRREANMMQRMQHPHIIQLFEVMETENCYYIVMELIEGIEFVKYLSKRRSLDENETRQYIRQICSAVDHMHKAKVVHRDIKLQNFMLDQNQNLTIIDFGLSNSLDDREFLNTQCGSPAYAAPEIFAHQDYGPEVDIWSIGVNMYAMLAGKLPFKVENRSKNLAKLHACILKGFEVPPFLSPDCQDLLCRLLEPTPSKRIKMHEIFAHPWLNYNCYPVELIPYKPLVDLKEINIQIVQYLVQKYDYTESEVIEAILYRKPIALKAIYYLVEKRLKQGLSFPETDYIFETNPTITTNNHSNNGSRINHFINRPHDKTNHSSLSNQTSIQAAQINSSNSNAGVVKHNSQLLPRRNNVPVTVRSNSQKHVDFKALFAMNGNGNRSTYNDAMSVGSNVNTNVVNNNSSDSPSPDFIAAAIKPSATPLSNQTNNSQSASASANRNSRSNQHVEYLNRKLTATSNNTNETSNLIRNNSTNDYMYYMGSNNTSTANTLNLNGNASNNNNMNNGTTIINTEDYHQPFAYFQSADSRLQTNPSIQVPNGSNSSSASNNHVLNNQTRMLNTNGSGSANAAANGLRSLPNSLYRGSPERSLPRSPERNENFMNRPTTSRISSSRPSVAELTTNEHKNYDIPLSQLNTSNMSNSNKYKTANVLTNKRSLTSYDESLFEGRQKAQNNANILANGSSNSNSNKIRQLQMGKAKIDFDTQTNLNVGVSIKNIGNYLKSSFSRTTPETIKSFNSINVKPSSAYNKANAISTPNNVLLANDSKPKQAAANLVHRHSNPIGSYATSNASHASAKNRVSLNDATGLPRIRINS